MSSPKKPSYDELKQRLAAAESELRALRESTGGEGETLAPGATGDAARQAHLKQVLLAIRNVNQLIVAEDDPQRLIERACVNLTETLGYYNAWIALLGGERVRELGLPEEGAVAMAAADGFDGGLESLYARLKRREFPECMKRALADGVTVVIENPVVDCPDCPLSSEYVDRASLARRLEFDGVTWGVLTTSVPAAFARDTEEQDLFNELADDLAFALHKIATARKLKQSEESYRRIMANARDMIYRMSIPEGRYEFVNAAAFQITGHRPEAFLKKPFLIKDIIHPAWQDFFKDEWGKLLAGQAKPEYEYQIIHAQSGEERWLSQRNVLIRDKEDRPVAIEGIVTDITERKRVQQALEHSKDRYELAMEATHDGLWDWDLTSGHVSYSLGWGRILGVDSCPPCYETWASRICEGDRDRVLGSLQRHLAGETEDWQEEHRLYTESGEWRWVLGRGRVIARDEEGKPLRVVGTMTDIHDRKQLQQDLEKAHEFLETVLDKSPFPMWIGDADGTLIRTNQALRELLNLSDEQLVGRYNPLHDLNIVREGLTETVREVIEQHKPARFSMLWRPVDFGGEGYEGGRNLHVDLAMYPIVRDGKLQNIVTQWQDITERVQAEARYEDLYENAPDMYLSVDAETGLVKQCNRILLTKTGYSRDEVIESPVFHLYAPESLAAAKNAFQQFVDKGEVNNVELRLRCKDGGAIDISLNVTAIRDETGAIVRSRSIWRDITEEKRAAEALRRSEGRLRQMFETNMAVKLVIEPVTGRIVDANKAACQFYGYDFTELTQLRIMDINVLSEQEIREEMERARTEERLHFNFTHRLACGEIREVEVFSGPLEEDGKTLLYSIIHDVSDRKRAERAREVSEARYTRLVTNIPGVVFQNLQYSDDPTNDEYTYISPGVRNLFGLMPEEVIGGSSSIWSLIYPEDMDLVIGSIKNAMETDARWSHDFRITTTDGEVKWVRGMASQEKQQDGRILWDGLLLDITERKRAEQALRESEDFLNRTGDMAQVGGWELDLETQQVTWTQTTKRIHDQSEDYSPSLEEAIGYYHPEDQEYVRQCVRRAIEDGESFDFIVRLTTAKGRERWVRALGQPIFKSGHCVKLSGTFQDITESKKAENELQQKNRQLQAFWELSRLEGATLKEVSDHALRAITEMAASPYGFYGFMKEDESEMNVHAWSGEAMKDCGVVDQSTRFILDECGVWAEAVRQRKPLIINDYSQPHEGKQGLPSKHVEIKRLLVVPFIQGGRIKSVIAVANRSFDYGQEDVSQIEAFLSGIQHIVDRHLVEEDLRRFEWLLDKEKTGSELPENSSSLIYEPPTKLNRSKVILDGVGSDNLHAMAKDILDLMDTCVAIYEANGDYAYGAFESGWCQLMDESSFKLCGTCDTKEALESGKWLCHESCWNESCKAAMESGKPTDIQCVGGIRLYAVPIFAGDEIIGAMNIGYQNPPTDETSLGELAKEFDIDKEVLLNRARAYKPRPPFIIEHAKRRCHAMSEMIGKIVERQRAEEEKERVEGQLLQAQKMESVGRLAGGVAHDFNNMLNVILGYAELMSESLPDDSSLREGLEEIRKAGERSANLTRQLLAFARKQTVAPMDLDLNETVASMLTMLQRLIGEDIDLLWKPGRSLDTVRFDPGQVDQILANLAVNARDAIGHTHGKITIETANFHADEAYCDDQADFRPGDYVMLAVSDDGSGMDEETLANIFEPFFTTKGVGEGTGLGLATVYGIVKQNDGFIHVYSEPEQGTTFKIHLPALAKAPVSCVEAEAGSGSPDTGNETILVVEDQIALLDMTKIMLEQRGYTVLAASTPSEALRVAREQSCRLDLLITDVVMPEMNGRELAEQLQLLCPGLRGIFMSGYTADVIADQGVLEEGVNFIQKPFSLKELAKTVRQALDS